MRLPAEPLFAALGNPSNREAAVLLGFADKSSIPGLRSRGLSFKQADHFAIKVAHQHPALIWGELWWTGTEAEA